jgi:hypothetical protein
MLGIHDWCMPETRLNLTGGLVALLRRQGDVDPRCQNAACTLYYTAVLCYCGSCRLLAHDACRMDEPEDVYSWLRVQMTSYAMV